MDIVREYLNAADEQSRHGGSQSQWVLSRLPCARATTSAGDWTPPSGRQFFILQRSASG